MAKIQIPESDWDMSDWPADEITVAGVVAALEGCGTDDEPVAVIDACGQELRLAGVRVHGSRIEIVVEVPSA
jgi:hypothetical protein